MQKAEEYLRHAEECRALARKAAKEEERRQLNEMADTWLQLAEQRAARIIGRTSDPAPESVEPPPAPPSR